MTRSAKKPKNLSLLPESVQRGKRYSRLHGTNLSRLVDNFLLSLPLEEAAEPQSPTVRRLRGVIQGSKSDRETYRKHLVRKYGK